MEGELFVYGRKIMKVDNRYYDVITNKLYMLLFYHDATNEYLWTSTEEAKYNEYDPKKYSILSNFTEDYKKNNAYQFLLEYPEVNTYVIWQQSSNLFMPESINENQQVDGYKAIRVDSQLQFSGLSLSYQSNSCLIDGIAGGSGWFYAIGVKTNYYSNQAGYIPGPLFKNTNAYFVNHVALWVHFPLQSQYTCKAKTRFVSPRILALFIIIYS